MASSVITGGVTVTAATLVPLVTWAMGGFPKPIPDGIPYLVAAGLVTGGHAAYNIVRAHYAAKNAPAAPVAPPPAAQP